MNWVDLEKSLVQVITANSLRFALLLSQLCIAAVYSSVALSNTTAGNSLSAEHQFVVGEALVIPVEVPNTGGLSPRFELVSAPIGARLVDYADGTVLFHWIPTPSAADQTSAVIKVIHAKNESLLATSRFTLNRKAVKSHAAIKVVEQTSPIALASNTKTKRSAVPEYPALPAQTLIVNEQYQMLFNTVDNNGLKVGIVSVDLPDGAVIANGRNKSRVLSWLPAENQAGEHRATIVVFNADEISARQRIDLKLTVLSSKPTSTLDLPEFATPGDQTEIKLIPAAAKELVIPEPDATQALESNNIRGSHLLPTYLTDPAYKIGESR